MTNPGEKLGPEKEGARWLRAVGRADVIGKPYPLEDGSFIAVEDFPEVSPFSAQSMRLIDRFGPDHPASKPFIDIARQKIENVFGPPPEQQ